jgi:hypothetical protein
MIKSILIILGKFISSLFEKYFASINRLETAGADINLQIAYKTGINQQANPGDWIISEIINILIYFDAS